MTCLYDRITSLYDALQASTPDGRAYMSGVGENKQQTTQLKCSTKRLIKLHLSLNRNRIFKVNESEFNTYNLCTRYPMAGLIYS